MNRVKRITKVVDALTDPDPSFVSVVGRGANQTPFRFVKEDQAQPPDTTMKKSASTPAEDRTAALHNVTNGFDIERLEFTKAAFADEAAVTDYLTTSGYSDFTVEAKDDTHWVVKGVDAAAFEKVEELPVPGVDGVVAFFGKLKKAEPAKGDKSNESKSDTPPLASRDGKTMVACYEAWSMPSTAGDTSVQDIISARIADGMPPGLWEVFDALRDAVREAIKAGNIAAIQTRFSEGGDLATRLATLFTTLSGAGFKKEADALVEPPTTATKTDEPAGDGKEKSTKSEEPPAPAFGEAEVAQLITNALEPLTTRLAALEAGPKDVVVKADLATATEAFAPKEALTKLEERITSIEQTRLARRSSSPGSTPTSEKKADDGKRPMTKSEANAAGIAWRPGLMIDGSVGSAE